MAFDRVRVDMNFYPIRLDPNASNRGDIAEENFNQEIRELIECFWREFVQNFLDLEKHDNDLKKSLRINVILNSDVPNLEFLDSILKDTKDCLRRSGYQDPISEIKNPGILVIEEVNTCGICGGTDPNQVEESEDQFWTNFWFTDGKPTKTGTKRGRRGQGKVTYHSVSGFRSVFAITKRDDDQKTLLFGKCRFRSTFSIDKQRYDNYGLFGQCDSKTKVILPFGNSSDISEFEKNLGLPHRQDYGTTWVFPYTDLEDFEFLAILKILASEYNYAIVSEELVVEYKDKVIDRETLPELIRSCGLNNPSQEKIEFLEDCLTLTPMRISSDWSGEDKYSSMNTDAFENEFDELSRKFKEEETVALLLPIEVEPKNGDVQPSEISVFLRASSKLERTDEQIIRSSLLIADEKHLSGIPGKFYGLVIASHPPIATFLSESENAAHVRFNERLVADKYHNVRSTLRSVRFALPQLARMLGFSEARDVDALASILSIPGKSKVRRPPPPPPPPPPPLQPLMFNCIQNKGQFIVRKNSEYSYPLPEKILMKFGYETGYGVGDPIKNWSPFDFDLEDANKHIVSLKDAKVLQRKGNEMEIEFSGSEPIVKIIGFSEITRIEVQISEVTE